MMSKSYVRFYSKLTQDVDQHVSTVCPTFTSDSLRIYGAYGSQI